MKFPRFTPRRQEGQGQDRIKQAEERLLELDAELARVALTGASVATLVRHHRNNAAAAAGADAYAERKVIEAERDRYREALGFYAQERHYGVDGNVLEDGGEIARAALYPNQEGAS